MREKRKREVIKKRKRGDRKRKRKRGDRKKRKRFNYTQKKNSQIALNTPPHSEIQIIGARILHGSIQAFCNQLKMNT